MVSGHCLVVNCGFRRARKSKNQVEFEKTEGKPVRFFQVPAAIMNQGDAQRDLTAERRHRWISAINRSDSTDSILKNGTVCSRHFTSGSPAQSWERFYVDWVPTLFLGHEKQSAEKSLSAAAHAERTSNRKRRMSDVDRGNEKRRLLQQQQQHTSQQRESQNWFVPFSHNF